VNNPYEGIPSNLLTKGGALIAGVDEVGRGCLFGPVFAAVVAVPLEYIPLLLQLGVKDSKKLSHCQRYKIFQQMQSHNCIYRLSYATAQEIDQLNILQASLKAMSRAVNKLPQKPDCTLVDGKFPIPNFATAQYTLIRGDDRSPVIALASIIAKLFRDELIDRFAQKYPQYGLSKHKGYPTAVHIQSLREYGPCPQHRFSFAPVRELGAC